MHVLTIVLKMSCKCVMLCQVNAMLLRQSMNIDQNFYLTGVKKFLRVEHSVLKSKVFLQE